MKEIPDGSVDCVITDPPYGLDFQGEEWDSFIPNWIAEARRIAPLVVFTTAPTTQWDYPRPDWVCCWYREAAQSRSMLGGGFNHWSPILVYGKVKVQIDCLKLHAISERSHGIDHPSPKPIKLLLWLTDNFTKEGQTILDPFMGSGTTGVACVQTGRNFIGIEKDEKYFEIAKRRIESSQLPLFT